MNRNLETFFGRKLAVTLDTDFVLYGYLVDVNEHGIWFETDEEKSFLSFKYIKAIRFA
jgi:hypothetical protein